MRIVAGTAKGCPLLVPKEGVRPTQDRIREALFNILQHKLSGTSVLDLFCGTGAVGLEALSRGAAYACMVDASHTACTYAHRNTERTRLCGGRILQADCITYTQRVYETFDIIFADPPYCKAPGDRDFIAELLCGRTHELLRPDGIFIAEAQANYGIGSEQNRLFTGWELIDRRNYGKNTLLFYRAAP